MGQVYLRAILKMNEKSKSKLRLPKIIIRGQIIPQLKSPRWLKKILSWVPNYDFPHTRATSLKSFLPQRFSLGFVLSSLTREHIKQYGRLYFPTSNNEAEYEAIIVGLELALATNKTLLTSLNKRLEEPRGKWVDELPGVLWAYRTTNRRPTRVTSFALAYGMEVVIPIEIGLPTRTKYKELWDLATYIRLPPFYIRLPATLHPTTPLYIRLLSLYIRAAFHPDDIRNYAPPPFPSDAFTTGIQEPDVRGGRFNFFGYTYSDSMIALTRRVYSHLVVPRFSLEASHLCDRHCEIFCFRYLISKSPNSPCNPPITGFLSY
uniref:Uncharacterized protein n=1 Tax=Vitis vinifera TaxID=29760 RepID=A5C368_VITVI|nr:hypothetical protein VITISV_033068 [Vitis vinifera]